MSQTLLGEVESNPVTRSFPLFLYGVLSITVVATTRMLIVVLAKVSLVIVMFLLNSIQPMNAKRKYEINQQVASPSQLPGHLKGEGTLFS